jgi:GAF domain-containing protein
VTAVPRDIESLFADERDPAALFEALMPAAARALSCQRCLLFLRDPVHWWSCCTHGWWDLPEHAFPREKTWRRQSESLAVEDPMFGEALRNPIALFIEDVETAGPEVLNLEYERRDFGHRALIHAPLFHDGRCFGIFEPCVFERPRAWTAADRALTAWLQERLGALAARYVADHAPR